MSYAVPHVGLKVEKLDAYLATWGVPGNNFAVNFSQIHEQYKIAISVKAEDWEAARDRQIMEIKKAFDLMANTLFE
jgi:hypothetical protein